MPKGRVGKLEKQRRIDLIQSLYAKGLTTSQIIQVTIKHFNVSERQAYRYIEATREQMLLIAKDPDKIRAINTLRREYLYIKAIEKEEIQVANSILDSTEKALITRGVKRDESSPGFDSSEMARLLEEFAKENKTE